MNKAVVLLGVCLLVSAGCGPSKGSRSSDPRGSEDTRSGTSSSAPIVGKSVTVTVKKKLEEMEPLAKPPREIDVEVQRHGGFEGDVEVTFAVSKAGIIEIKPAKLTIAQGKTSGRITITSHDKPDTVEITMTPSGKDATGIPGTFKVTVVE